MIGTSSTAQVVANGRAKWTPVRPAEQLRWPTPVYLGGPTIDLLHRLPDRLPELGLAEIHGASVFGSHGWVVVDDSLLEGQSWFGSALQAEVGLPNDGLDRVPLPGVTLSLLSEWADVNYGHLLYDAVPRLDLFERSGYPIEKVDTILCAAPEHLVPLWRELGLDPVKGSRLV